MAQKESRKGRGKGSAKRVRQRRVLFQGWKTNDQEEIERRRIRAARQPIEIEALEPEQDFYGTFHARSQQGSRSYVAEIRSLDQLQNSCDCPDFRVNGLGTCKHIEAVLASLRRRRVRAYRKAAREGSPRTEIYLSWGDGRGTPEVRISWSASGSESTRNRLEPFFSTSGSLLADPAHALPAIRRSIDSVPEFRSEVRIARDVSSWVEELGRLRHRSRSREDFLNDVKAGKRPLNFLKHPLYPYQQEGMLHLAFSERALLADDMGLGKTVQEEDGRPALEILDRASYETVQRLIRQGFLLEAEGGLARRLHCHSLLAEGQGESRSQRAAEARKCLAGMDRKIRMVELLVEGGFAAEALPTAAEIVRAALEALAVFHGEVIDRSETKTALPQLEKRLNALAVLPESSLSSGTRILGALEDGNGCELEAARQLVEAGLQTYEHAAAAVGAADSSTAVIAQ